MYESAFHYIFDYFKESYYVPSRPDPLLSALENHMHLIQVQSKSFTLTQTQSVFLLTAI